MQLQPAQLVMLLQWSDSAFPTGAFAHSGGLETYTQVEVVRSADELARLIDVKLASAAGTDLIVIHEAMTAYTGPNRARLHELDALLSASKLARELREASEKVGRRMLSNVLNLLPDDVLLAFRDDVTAGRCAGHHAIVHGLACAALGLDADAALLAFAYGLAANQTAAAMKLMSLGQTQAQAVLAAAGPAMAAAVALALARTLDDYGSFTPALDIRAMQHEFLFRRLFIS